MLLGVDQLRVNNLAKLLYGLQIVIYGNIEMVWFLEAEPNVKRLSLKLSNGKLRLG